MPTIRILHASDLHVAKVPSLIALSDRISAGVSLRKLFSAKAIAHTARVSTYDPTLLLALAEFINDDYESNHIQKRGAPIDAIVLTGDIATTGRTDDLERARDFLEKPYDTNAPAQQRAAPGAASISRVLTHDNCPCPNHVRLMLMPGNHDRLEPSGLKDYSPGGIEFDNVLGGHWKAAAHLKHHGPDVRELEIVKGSLRVSVIAADFNLKNSSDCQGHWWNKYAQGRVYRTLSQPDALDELEVATRKVPGDAVVLWATHFPPRFPYIKSAMKLINDTWLVEAANQRKVSAVLSGHTHEPVRYRSPEMDFEVLCAGTATQHYTSTGHHFHVIEIEGDNKFNAITSVEHYKHDVVSAFKRV